MFSWLKKHFIPHEGNNHRPHILRASNIRNLVVLVIFLEVFTFLIPTLTNLNMSGGMAAVLPAVLANLTNEERQAESLGVLTINPILNQAAEMKAEDMATHGYFAHTSPDGKTPWYWLEKVGYKYQYAGENLAINFSDSKDVTNAWMASPTHKANIEKGNYTEIGTGVATGMYEGQETIFVAQIYANPLPETPTKIESQKSDIEITKTVSKIKEGQPANVLGAEAVVVPENNIFVPVKPIQQPNLLQESLASPRNTTNKILYVIFGVIVIALLLYLFIKMRNHHKDLITNGLILLAILGAIFVVNYYFTNHNMIVGQSFDYSNVNK